MDIPSPWRWMCTGAEAAALLRISEPGSGARPSPGERRPAEARRAADPLGMQARGSAARLRAARLASGEEAAGLRLGGGKVLDHPVQHGLELAQAVHGLLHDREEEQETIRQLSIDAALD